MAGIIANFKRSSLAAIGAAIDPVSGLASKHKHLPTLQEIREFCEQFDGVEHRRQQREASERQQLAERELLERQGQETSTEDRAAIVDHVKDAMRATGFKFNGDGSPASVSADRERLMKLGNLSREQFEELPAAVKSGDYWKGVRWSREEDER